MKNEVGETTVRALLVLLIGKTVQFLNVGKTMGGNQVIETADLIMDDEYYSVHKPDYFILCFNRAKKGQYGKQYDRIDGQVIFEWLAQFDYEYTVEIEAARVNEQRKMERDTVMTEAELNPEEERNKPVPMPEETKQMLRGLGRTQMPASTKVLTGDETVYFQALIMEFRWLFDNSTTAKNGRAKEMGGQAFLKIENRFMTCNEYMQYRVLAKDRGRNPAVRK